jgi:hypothetical protein
LDDFTIVDAVGYNEDPEDHPDDIVYGFNVTPPGEGPPDPDAIIRDVRFTTSFADYISGVSGNNQQSDYDTDIWYAVEMDTLLVIETIEFKSSSTLGDEPDVLTPGDPNDQ